MLNSNQLRGHIIVPALSYLHLYSDDAAELLLFTCAVESRGGTYLKQLNGPALGIYQMEPKTYNDIWQNFVRKRGDIAMILGAQFNAFHMPDENRMIYDLYFATAMARLHYRRVQEPLPDRKDVNAIWEYYKKYYNTIEGKAKKDQSIDVYLEFIEQPKNSKPSTKETN